MNVTAKTIETGPTPHWNPYLAGIGLGLTLLLSYIVLGTGLGASGAIARAGAAAVQTIAPTAAAKNPMLADYADGGSPLRHYLVFMAIGVFFGGLSSALAARRIRPMLERGPASSPRRRMIGAIFGGILVGAASRLAMGCTSGQALSGGAVFSTGAWVFMGAVFAAAFLFAPLVKKEWMS